MSLGKSKKRKTGRNGSKKKSITIKKMNCHPGVQGKTVSSDTCYTTTYLLKIRNAYNKKHPKNPIKSNKAHVILENLRSNLQCGQEDCWLKQLSEQDRKIIDDKVFAPDHPTTWNKNPTEWLSNYDILNVLTQYETTFSDFKFIGPTPIDFASMEEGDCIWPELCNINLSDFISKKKNKIGIIFNLDKHDESGSHWVSMFLNIREGILFYFDSAANETPLEIINLINKILKQANSLSLPMKYITNYPKQHQQSNTECGMYSLYFIITMIDKTKSIKTKIEMFQNQTITDSRMKLFRKKYFNSK